MDSKEMLKRVGSVILVFSALVVLLGGYLASHLMKNNLFIAGGIALGIVIIAIAAVLGNME